MEEIENQIINQLIQKYSVDMILAINEVVKEIENEEGLSQRDMYNIIVNSLITCTVNHLSAGIKPEGIKELLISTANNLEALL